MNRIIKYLSFVSALVVVFIPGISKSQFRIAKRPNEVLLLQLSSGFLTVVKQGRVDLDSTLLTTSKRNLLSRIPLITEGFDGRYNYLSNSWMDNSGVDVALKQLKMTKGEAHARSLLLIGAYLAFQPKSEKDEIIRAISYLKLAEDEYSALRLPKWVAQCNVLLGKCYMKGEDISQGDAAFKRVIDFALSSGDQELQAKALNYQGLYTPFRPETNLFRINCLTKAFQLYTALKDPVNQINTQMDIAYLSFAMGKVEACVAAVRRSCFLQKKINFPFTHYSNDLLAYIARLKGDYAAELEFALGNVKSAEATKDSLPLGYLYARVADAYIYADNHISESNVWYRKALDKFLQHGGDPAFYLVFTSNSFIEYGLGNSGSLLKKLEVLVKKYPPLNTIDEQNVYLALATCNEKLGHYQTAEKFYLMAEKLEAPNRLIRGDITNGYIYHKLGHFYLRIKDHKNNRLYNLKYLAASKIHTDSLILADTYWALFQADSAQGDFNKMQNLYAYTMLKQKLYTSTKNKLVEELDIRYQTLQKQKDLEMYKAQDMLRLQQVETTRRVSYAGLVILLLIISFILLGYFNKQKSNRLLKIQKNEIDQKNSQLEHVINEKDELIQSKEWLLKEVHHRVKNNLQLVMSLLNSQTAYLKDELALNAVRESRHRVQAMSLIHQKLYKEENVSSIEMREYIKSLVAYLKESFKTKLTIFFNLQVEPILLDISQAIPVGLILNELITNSIKYAFPHTADDRIVIMFSKSGQDEIVLHFADNGAGLPDDFDPLLVDSFGMKLVQGLTDDLGGLLLIESVSGTAITITFRNTEFFHGQGEDLPV